jgi:hypothetical protein
VKKFPILLDLFLTFAKIGAFTFGGGYAMISVIDSICVDKKKWITHDEMMDVTVIAESTPGPISVNCATFVGFKQAGWLGGVMATLERAEACGISLDECHTLEVIEILSDEERQNLLLPTERLFDDLDAVRLPAFFEKLFRDGCPVYQKKIKTAFEIGSRVRVYDENGKFFALGEIVEREGGSAVKSIKIFEL